MEQVIYFNNHNQTIDMCAGEVYYEFLDYAFCHADYFMLVYVNYYGKGYSQTTKRYKKLLAPFKVKTRTNPSWPGTPSTYTPNSTYKIIFYKTNKPAKEVLRNATKISDWSAPNLPEDIAFFKGNHCWFYSVGHEKIAAFIRATKSDFEFLEAHNLGKQSDAITMNAYYKQFDEEFPKKEAF